MNSVNRVAPERAIAEFPGTGLRRFAVPAWKAVALIAVCLGVVGAIRFALTPWLGDRPVLVLFILPILIGAYLGGLTAGVAATFLSAAFTFVFFVPHGEPFDQVQAVDVVQWSVFVACGLAISLVCEKLHRFRSSAELRLQEQLRAEMALNKAERNLRHVIDNMVEGVVISDDQGRLIHWNQAALELHGLTPSGEWCLHFHDFTKIFRLSELGGKVIPVEEWPLARILRGERLNNLPVRIQRLDTDWVSEFSYGGSMIDDGSGQRFGFVTITDISESIRSQEILRSMNQELEQRVRERTAEMEYTIKELEAFTYSVSHDLRAPLRAIDGFSELALEDYGGQLPEEGRHYLQTIRESAQRMRNLIEDLLAFSRISRAAVQLMEIDTGHLVREVVKEHLLGYSGKTPAVTIGDLPSCRADHALLKQVWSNLIENAIKYSSKSENPSIEIGSLTNEGRTTYFVRDNGIGFDMAYVDKLFEVFQRLHRHDQYEGTGVGLAVVHRVVTRHGGKVWAEAKEGEGATFYFTIEGEEAK